jgi:hypothetical protein
MADGARALVSAVSEWLRRRQAAVAQLRAA